MEYEIIAAWSFAILYIACKHWLADFVYQNHYMLGKFNPPPKCYLPLAAHCMVHVFLLSFYFLALCIAKEGMIQEYGIIMLGILVYEFVTHYVVDIIKAQLTRIYQWKPADHIYWIAIGIDQMMHTLFSIPVIYFLAEMTLKLR